MDKNRVLKVLEDNSIRAYERLGLMRLVESPIEELFAIAFWSRYDWVGDAMCLAGVKLDAQIRLAKYEMPKIIWSPQTEVRGLRVDFIFCQALLCDRKPVVVAVECDGHDFHEKTKEQAARDKARDRRLVKAGIRVLRFTGSEIYKDANACAEEVFQVLNSEWCESSVAELDRISEDMAHGVVE
jgi:very-short-patch-repair endonuclease